MSDVALQGKFASTRKRAYLREAAYQQAEAWRNFKSNRLAQSVWVEQLPHDQCCVECIDANECPRVVPWSLRLGDGLMPKTCI